MFAGMEEGTTGSAQKEGGNGNAFPITTEIPFPVKERSGSGSGRSEKVVREFLGMGMGRDPFKGNGRRTVLLSPSPSPSPMPMPMPEEEDSFPRSLLWYRGRLAEMREALTLARHPSSSPPSLWSNWKALLPAFLASQGVGEGEGDERLEREMLTIMLDHLISLIKTTSTSSSSAMSSVSSVSKSKNYEDNLIIDLDQHNEGDKGNENLKNERRKFRKEEEEEEEVKQVKVKENERRIDPNLEGVGGELSLLLSLHLLEMMGRGQVRDLNLLKILEAEEEEEEEEGWGTLWDERVMRGIFDLAGSTPGKGLEVDKRGSTSTSNIQGVFEIREIMDFYVSYLQATLSKKKRKKKTEGGKEEGGGGGGPSYLKGHLVKGILQFLEEEARKGGEEGYFLENFTYLLEQLYPFNRRTSTPLSQREGKGWWGTSFISNASHPPTPPSSQIDKETLFFILKFLSAPPSSKELCNWDWISLHILPRVPSKEDFLLGVLEAGREDDGKAYFQTCVTLYFTRNEGDSPGCHLLFHTLGGWLGRKGDLKGVYELTKFAHLSGLSRKGQQDLFKLQIVASGASAFHSPFKSLTQLRRKKYIFSQDVLEVYMDSLITYRDWAFMCENFSYFIEGPGRKRIGKEGGNFLPTLKIFEVMYERIVKDARHDFQNWTLRVQKEEYIEARGRGILGFDVISGVGKILVPERWKVHLQSRRWLEEKIKEYNFEVEDSSALIFRKFQMDLLLGRNILYYLSMIEGAFESNVKAQNKDLMRGMLRWSLTDFPISRPDYYQVWRVGKGLWEMEDAKAVFERSGSELEERGRRRELRNSLHRWIRCRTPPL